MKEEIEKIIEALKGKLDETTNALVSDELVSILGAVSGIDEKIAELNDTIETLKSEKEEILKVNGKLYQKIGFDEPAEETPEEMPEEEVEEKIEDIIDEKGNIL